MCTRADSSVLQILFSYEDEESRSVIALLRLQENQSSYGLRASGLDVSELLRVDIRALGST